MIIVLIGASTPRFAQPRLFFMHFWANDDAIKLAKGLRTALDQMANIKNSL